MALPEIMWKELTQVELELLAQKVSDETNRRSQIDALPGTIDSMIRDLKRFEGYGEGTVWVRPDNATRAYPKGWRTRHADKEWESTVSGNLEEPGTTGWIEVVDSRQPPEWVEPVSPDRAYPTKAEVMHNAAEWVSIKDANVEEPGAPETSAPGWQRKSNASNSNKPK